MRASLVFHYGHSSPGPNIKLYNTVASAMADMFRKRCESIPKGIPNNYKTESIFTAPLKTSTKDLFHCTYPD
jgi:hypothetical protein